ncbi:L-glutamate gamma-semialdehyde dehydrogenase [bacterium]|nr:L-glutamate gamma-semialdehyde dehydrogenase [bacterium]
MNDVDGSQLPGFANEPHLDFSRAESRDAFADALAHVQAKLPLNEPLVINGRRIETSERIKILSPSDVSLVVGESACAGQAETELAIDAAEKAFHDWAATSAAERANLLLKVAEITRVRRLELAAIEVFECAKPWREADADICEAIDFMEYYAREMLRLGEPLRLQPDVLGEKNELVRLPLGVVAVIGPWNFPLAIPVGMMSAALVAGNTIVWKPARQSPLILGEMMRIFEEAGVSEGVINYLPGLGETAGRMLVESPRVHMIAFTGSREVGLSILRAAGKVPAGQRFVKRMVVEMGGKNAMIVDASADIDAALGDILVSAFGYSGQKCSALSRLIVHESIADELIKRFRDAVDSLKIAPAWDPGCQVNALIDNDARVRVERAIELGCRDGSAIYIGNLGEFENRGHYVAPAIFEGLPKDHELVRQEIFGPVVIVLRARTFEEAIEIANDSDYGLTGGVFSRTPSNLELARREMQCGNLYLNRAITGAIVGRQPFGGMKLSGIGDKAGGPGYLQQFMTSRAISENLMRHGYAPVKQT